MTNTLMLNGQSPDVVYRSLLDKGVTDYDATKIIGDWILQGVGGGTRRFTFSNPVSGTESPDCAPRFVRSFVHDDWVDGVSVVQAGLTAGEKGFNDRLHRIENDLDALSADINRLFSCLADLRSSVAQSFGEVANELNQIDVDLGERGGRPPVAESSQLGSAATQYVGTTKYFDQPVNVWQTPQGILTLPAVQPPATAGTPLLINASSFATFAQGTAALAQTFTGAPVSVQTVLDHFGSQTIDASGTTVQQALSVLPATAQYTSLADLTAALASSSAAVIKASGIGDATIATSFTSLGSGVQAVASTPIDRLAALPAGSAAALASAGITTVGALATANPGDVNTALTKAGIQVSVAEAAGLTTIAKTLNALQ